MLLPLLLTRCQRCRYASRLLLADIIFDAFMLSIFVIITIFTMMMLCHISLMPDIDAVFFISTPLFRAIFSPLPYAFAISFSRCLRCIFSPDAYDYFSLCADAFRAAYASLPLSFASPPLRLDYFHCYAITPLFSILFSFSPHYAITRR